MLPTGAVTFVFTDIEGSTQLLQKSPEEFPALLETHNRIIRDTFEIHGGKEVDRTGDGFFYVFQHPEAAVKGVAEAQRKFQQYPWQAGRDIRVRVGVHTGHARLSSGTYIGLDVHKTARIMSVAYGGQILISGDVARQLNPEALKDISVTALGEFLLKDIRQPELLYLVRYAGYEDHHESSTAKPEHHNLPGRATPLIGRDVEISTITTQLRAGNIRLLSLVGPGGIGKTSLAIESAKVLLNDYKDGVFITYLAPLTEARFIPNAIAHTLGCYINTGTTVTDQLLEFIGQKYLLLILDNMEHVIDGTVHLVKLLEGCPHLKFIVTSRSVLRVSWEWEFPVPPLSVDFDPSGRDIAEDISPSVRLFVQRAQAVDPHFMPSNEELGLIMEICDQLDGLPLAIELAAARIKVLSPKAILSRLCKSLDLLRGGTSDLPERHQALRHTIDWSYNLLGREEQALFRRLGVYAGGFTLDAAEAAYAEMDSHASNGLDIITALRDQSLIRVEEINVSDPRYTMLETIREYALERLEETGEEERARASHAKWFLNVAEEAARHFTGSDSKDWLDATEAELENLRAAMKWCVQTGDADTGLGMCNAMWRFWVIRALLQEGVSMLNQMLALPEANKLIIPRAKALNALGTMMHEISDFKGASELLPKAIALFREAGDENNLALALNNLGWVSAQIGDLDDGIAHTMEAFAIHQSHQELRGMGVSKNNLGFIAMCRSDYDLMRGYYQEHYAYMAEIGDRRGLAYSLLCQTFGELDTGRLPTCQTKIDEAAHIVKEIGERQMIAWARTLQAYLLYWEGQYEKAKQNLYDTVEKATKWNNRLVVSYELLLLGASEQRLGNLSSALEILEETLGYARYRGSKFLEGLVTKELAHYYLTTGDERKAIAFIVDTFQGGKNLENRVRMIQSAELLAKLRTSQCRYPVAAALYGITEHLRETLNVEASPADREFREKDLETLKASMEASSLEDAMKPGTLETLEALFAGDTGQEQIPYDA